MYQGREQVKDAYLKLVAEHATVPFSLAEDPAALMEAELSSSKAKLSETMATISYVHAERGAVCLLCVACVVRCNVLYVVV